MSETPDTDQLEDSDFHKYGDDDAVPLACYHRMTAHARSMEASAKVAAKMLGEAWEEVKEARAIAKEACEMLADNGFETNYPPMPWEEADTSLDSENDYSAETHQDNCKHE